MGAQVSTLASSSPSPKRNLIEQLALQPGVRATHPEVANVAGTALPQMLRECIWTHYGLVAFSDIFLVKEGQKTDKWNNSFEVTRSHDHIADLRNHLATLLVTDQQSQTNPWNHPVSRIRGSGLFCGHVKLDKSLTIVRSKRRDLCFSSALMTTLVVSGKRLTTLSAPPLVSQFWILTKLLIKRKMMPTNFRTSSGVSSRRRTFGSLHAGIVAKENGGAGLRLPHQRHGLGCGNRVKCERLHSLCTLAHSQCFLVRVAQGSDDIQVFGLQHRHWDSRALVCINFGTAQRAKTMVHNLRSPCRDLASRTLAHRAVSAVLRDPFNVATSPVAPLLQYWKNFEHILSREAVKGTPFPSCSQLWAWEQLKGDIFTLNEPLERRVPPKPSASQFWRGTLPDFRC